REIHLSKHRNGEQDRGRKDQETYEPESVDGHFALLTFEEFHTGYDVMSIEQRNFGKREFTRLTPNFLRYNPRCESEKRDLSHWPDCSQFQHHDGNRDPCHAPRTGGCRAGTVHIPLQPYAHEEGDEGGTRGDGCRLRPLCR